MVLVPHARFLPVARLLGVVTLGGLLAGCVANSSNPTVQIRSARMGSSDATLVLALSNPGGRRLTVERIDYELSHGDIGFPLAQDSWSGQLELPAQGESELPLHITFDTEPIEEDSTLLHLAGQLSLRDHTGFLGMDSMDLTETSFQADTEAERTEP